jgi:hypothetical protein
MVGNFNISIEGVGFHHNKNTPNDANRMAQKFVKELEAAGHMISHATITHGGKDYLGSVDYSRYDNPE